MAKRRRTAGEIAEINRRCKALERRDQKKLESGWTYAPENKPEGFMEGPHEPFRWTPPPKKKRQPIKKKNNEPVRSDDTHPRMDFGS